MAWVRTFLGHLIHCSGKLKNKEVTLRARISNNLFTYQVNISKHNSTAPGHIWGTRCPHGHQRPKKDPQSAAPHSQQRVQGLETKPRRRLETEREPEYLDTWALEYRLGHPGDTKCMQTVEYLVQKTQKQRLKTQI